MPALTLPLSARARRLWSLALSALAAAALACSLGSQPPTATPTAFAPPTDTAAAATDLPATVAPTDTAAPPTEPAAPTDTAVPATPDISTITETISIAAPGLGSQLTSPLHVEGFAEPTFEQNLVIQITDADGAVLALQPTTIQSEAGTAGPFSADVAFTSPTDQPGRLSVYSTSARDGGLIHLASVEVDLLASGAAVIVPAAERPEVHSLLVPAPLAEISGGVLHLEGYSEYVFEGTLGLALCGEGGSGAPEPICGTADNTIATGFAMLQSTDIGLPGPFSADLAYTVAAPVQARLVVYSLSARDGGLLHLTSIPVTLAP